MTKKKINVKGTIYPYLFIQFRRRKINYVLENANVGRSVMIINFLLEALRYNRDLWHKIYVKWSVVPSDSFGHSVLAVFRYTRQGTAHLSIRAINNNNVLRWNHRVNKLILRDKTIVKMLVTLSCDRPVTLVNR